MKKFEKELSEKPMQRAGASKCVSWKAVRAILEDRGYSYPRKAHVVAAMICKGGTGKTTTIFYTGMRLSSYGARVLLIAADPQGNLTSSFDLKRYGVEINAKTPVLIDVIEDKCDLEEVIINVTPNLHLVPSTPMNSAMDGKIRDKHLNASLVIRDRIKGVLKDYDYILIDCAPTLNLTNLAAVAAADTVFLPVNPDTYSQIGLEQTLAEITRVRRAFKDVKVETKIIFTKFDGREVTSLHFLGEIAKDRKDQLYETVIRTSADVKNAIFRGEDLFSVTRSTACADYNDLTKELMGLKKLNLRKRAKKD